MLFHETSPLFHPYKNSTHVSAKTSFLQACFQQANTFFLPFFLNTRQLANQIEIIKEALLRLSILAQLNI